MTAKAYKNKDLREMYVLSWQFWKQKFFQLMVCVFTIANVNDLKQPKNIASLLGLNVKEFYYPS